jgi:DNA-binding transcriptional regulator GbsR (MarR family)
MNRKKSSIDSSIDLLRKMLEDSNNELSSEQQSKLEKGIKELKRLKRATKLTYSQVSAVVGEIAKAAFEILTSGSSE